MLNHITIVTRRASPRIMQSKVGGTRHNLCGGELTDRDITVTQAKACRKVEEWVKCGRCLEILRGLK